MSPASAGNTLKDFRSNCATEDGFGDDVYGPDSTTNAACSYFDGQVVHAVQDPENMAYYISMEDNYVY